MEDKPDINAMADAIAIAVPNEQGIGAVQVFEFTPDNPQSWPYYIIVAIGKSVVEDIRVWVTERQKGQAIALERSEYRRIGDKKNPIQ